MDELLQLREENDWLKRENQNLCEPLAAAEAKTKQLVELLGQNSCSSSRPSSRDEGQTTPWEAWTAQVGQFCHLHSYISTIRKQGLNVWEASGSLFEGDVLMPQLTPV